MTDQSLLKGTLLKGKAFAYTIERKLGQGAFGITYLASVKMQGALGSINANVDVAIKEFFMRDINGRSADDATSVTCSSKQGIYTDYRRKFVREAGNLSKLNHPNIVKVIEAMELNNTVYYVMEYVEGGSLDSFIIKQGRLHPSLAVKYGVQICQAVAHMHKHGMVHLDIKPANIMLKEGAPVLIDFGLSKCYDDNGEPESSTFVGNGTPGYAPIEQASYLEGNAMPVTMDVYAIGATLFKMLTGLRPPIASSVLNEGFPAEALHCAGVEAQLIGVVEKAMAVQKSARYQSVAELEAALKACATDAGEYEGHVEDDDTVVDDRKYDQRETKDTKAEYNNTSRADAVTQPLRGKSTTDWDSDVKYPDDSSAWREPHSGADWREPLADPDRRDLHTGPLRRDRFSDAPRLGTAASHTTVNKTVTGKFNFKKSAIDLLCCSVIFAVRLSSLRHFRAPDEDGVALLVAFTIAFIFVLFKFLHRRREHRQTYWNSACAVFGVLFVANTLLWGIWNSSLIATYVGLSVYLGLLYCILGGWYRRVKNR